MTRRAKEEQLEEEEESWSSGSQGNRISKSHKLLKTSQMGVEGVPLDLVSKNLLTVLQRACLGVRE